MTLFEIALSKAKSGQLSQAWEDLLPHIANLAPKTLMLMYDIALLADNAQYKDIVLTELCLRQPRDFKWCQQRCALYQSQYRVREIVAVLSAFIAINPEHADAWFNLGYWCREAGDYEQAIAAYKQALLRSVSRPEEAHGNIANIYSQELLKAEEALEHYQASLALNPSYTGSIFNLASLYEKQGEMALALKGFVKAAACADFAVRAMARIIELPVSVNDRKPFVSALEKALDCRKLFSQADDSVDAYFALARWYEQQSDYARSWQLFSYANKIDERSFQVELVMDIKQVLGMNSVFEGSLQGLSENTSQAALKVQGRELPLVFICGMFRSGSTLLEQLLNTHPNITAGGEIDYFYRKVVSGEISISNFEQLDEKTIKKLREEYVQRIADMNSAKSHIVTDKRPDNFLLLGLIKHLFPRAKFIWTMRERSNNVFSIYSQRLGKQMPYASNLQQCAEYYDDHLTLLTKWQAQYPDDIHIVQYEDLVTQPDHCLQQVFSFLGIAEHHDFDGFNTSSNLVSTASMSQVRQALHQSAIDRVAPYKPFLPEF